MKYKSFYWDGHDNPPLREIFKAVKNIPDAKLWSDNTSADDFCLIVAADKTMALNCWKENHKEWIDSRVADGEDILDILRDAPVSPWKD